MSEIKSRPTGRSRGSGRGGRGGISARGRGGNRALNGTKPDTDEPSFAPEDEGEIGELKLKYASQLRTMKEMFPDWTDEDIVFALQETDGDLEGTVQRMTEGNVSQWGEVKKKTKDRSQSKQPRETAEISAESQAASSRSGRGRGAQDAGRTSRSRGQERGRGANRGGRGATTTTATSKSNGVARPAAQSMAKDSNQNLASGEIPAAVDALQDQSSSVQPVQSYSADDAHIATKADGKKTWASMFAKPTSISAHKTPRPLPSDANGAKQGNDASMQGLPPPLSSHISDIPNTPPLQDIASSQQVGSITPSKDDLTETNLEKVPDISGPVATATAASTVASTVDQRAVSGASLYANAQAPLSRPPLSGYAASAYKATSGSGRTSSYQRRILEQQEAVVMPGKHAVDKAAVQFGSMGLNGTPEDDVDSDREDAETRTQPPQHSPVAPRASLPPASQQSHGTAQSTGPEMQTLPRHAPGLPAANHHMSSQQTGSHPDSGALSSSAGAGSYAAYGESAGQPHAPADSALSSQKPYEPFGQQAQPSQHSYDPFNNEQQAALSNEQRQYLAGKYAAGPNNMSSYYTSEDPRNDYAGSQYASHTPLSQHAAQDPPNMQQRTGSAAAQTNQYGTAHGRFGQGPPESQETAQSSSYGSVNNPHASNQSHHMSQSGGPSQPGSYGYGGYPYGGYYSSYNMNQVSHNPYGRDRHTVKDARPYEDQYLTSPHQYGYGAGQGGYNNGAFGGAGAGKGAYGQHHPGYNMASQGSQDQTATTSGNANTFPQHSSTSGRDAGASSSLSGYGPRSGSTQPTDTTNGSHTGNIPDVFGRSASGYQGQSQGLGSINDDASRTYADNSKTQSGPSPALGQPGLRSGSAAQSSTPSGLPPQDARYGQQNYGAYSAGTQYGQTPGGSGQQPGQTHQGPTYGAYGGQGYGGSYYNNSNNNRGGWGSYGH